jgi:hypothetical protein
MGSFFKGDTVVEITDLKKEKADILFKVKWNKRIDGYKP